MDKEYETSNSKMKEDTNSTNESLPLLPLYTVTKKEGEKLPVFGRLNCIPNEEVDTERSIEVT
jgi:hypothetical protein